VPFCATSSVTRYARFAAAWRPASCHHPVLEVGDARRLDGPDLLELQLRCPEVVEETSTVAERPLYTRGGPRPSSRSYEGARLASDRRPLAPRPSRSTKASRTRFSRGPCMIYARAVQLYRENMSDEERFVEADDLAELEASVKRDGRVVPGSKGGAPRGLSAARRDPRTAASTARSIAPCCGDPSGGRATDGARPRDPGRLRSAGTGSSSA
jgi:hypothetical protein